MDRGCADLISASLCPPPVSVNRSSVTSSWTASHLSEHYILGFFSNKVHVCVLTGAAACHWGWTLEGTFFFFLPPLGSAPKQTRVVTLRSSPEPAGVQQCGPDSCGFSPWTCCTVRLETVNVGVSLAQWTCKQVNVVATSRASRTLKFLCCLSGEPLVCTEVVVLEIDWFNSGLSMWWLALFHSKKALRLNLLAFACSRVCVGFL